ncbi:IS1 family transposase [Providencia stuartii]
MATISVKCRFCGLTDPVKKHGTGNGGHPRYRCQACCRTFQIKSLVIEINSSK